MNTKLANHIWVIFLIIISFVSISAQKDALSKPRKVNPSTVLQLKAEYPNIFIVKLQKYGEKSFISMDVAELPKGHVLAPFVNSNKHFLLYLLENSTNINMKDLFAHKENPADLRKYFYSRLEQDEQFNSLILPILGQHTIYGFGSKSGGSSGETKRQVSFDEVVNIAVRFFYPDQVLPDGQIQAHICVGINGLKDIEGTRDPVMEAFAYSAIFRDLLKPKYKVEEDYKAAKRLMTQLKLSSENDVKLKRAQGVMWGVMAQSESLRRVLLDEYERNKEYLPFTISNVSTQTAILTP